MALVSRSWSINGVTGNCATIGKPDPETGSGWKTGVRRKQAQKVPVFGNHQYSDGRSRVVELRSASVMIQSFVPLFRV